MMVKTKTKKQGNDRHEARCSNESLEPTAR